jgi:hypothetical protein
MGPGQHDREQTAKIDDERAQKTLKKQGKADRAQRSGRGGRRFKSYHSDQLFHDIDGLRGQLWGTKPIAGQAHLAWVVQRS